MILRIIAVSMALLFLMADRLPALEERKGEFVISHIPRQQVQSSGISRLGYSKRRHLLEIEFSNGAVYRYINVSPAVYRDLISAESKARYYDTNIKRNYRSVRVRPRVKDQKRN